jgi:hypothetical protein
LSSKNCKGINQSFPLVQSISFSENNLNQVKSIRREHFSKAYSKKDEIMLWAGDD